MRQVTVHLNAILIAQASFIIENTPCGAERERKQVAKAPALHIANLDLVPGTTFQTATQ